MSGPGPLLVDDAGAVRTITFHRPEARNALDTEARAELCRLLDEADSDDAVAAVVLTGTDPAFTAGVDFTDLRPAPPGRARFRADPGATLRAMRTPVVCAVNGACVSGGLEIVLSATFAVASERARFADTHARLGAVPTWGLTALLPRAVGLRKAREMSLTGAFVDAAEALRLGLVNHVVAHAELGALAQGLAAQVAAAPPAGREILDLYDAGQDLSLSAALELEARHTADRRVDVDAFRAAGRTASGDQRRPGAPGAAG